MRRSGLIRDGEPVVLGWVWSLKDQDHRGDKDDSEVLSHQAGDGDMYGDGENLRRNKSELRREKIIQ